MIGDRCCNVCDGPSPSFSRTTFLSLCAGCQQVAGEWNTGAVWDRMRRAGAAGDEAEVSRLAGILGWLEGQRAR